MKRYFLIVILILMSRGIGYGTAQTRDVVIINGEEWRLAYAPLQKIDSKYLESITNHDDVLLFCTRGYYATWELIDNKLFLVSLFLMNSDHEFSYSELSAELSQYVIDGKIYAGWLTDDIIAGKGKIVRYKHQGFDQDTETEIILYVEKGNVRLSKVFTNYSLADADKLFTDSIKSIQSDFPKDQFKMKEGRYMFSAKRDSNTGKWGIKLLRSPVECENKSLLEKELTRLFQERNPHTGYWIRDQWYVLSSFTFPFIVE